MEGGRSRVTASWIGDWRDCPQRSHTEYLGSVQCASQPNVGITTTTTMVALVLVKNMRPIQPAEAGHAHALVGSPGPELRCQADRPIHPIPWYIPKR